MDEILKEKKRQNLIRLAKLFKETGENKYFEELWGLVKPFSIRIGQAYDGYMVLDYDEKISIYMECLLDCCDKLKDNCNLLTFYGIILKNRMYDRVVKVSRSKKYQLNKNEINLEVGMDKGYWKEEGTEKDIFSLDLFVSDCKLLKIEIIIVNLLNEGYKQEEIIKKLQIKKDTYQSLIKSIRDKVKNNYVDCTDGV